jgi:hypothetical protein
VNASNSLLDELFLSNGRCNHLPARNLRRGCDLVLRSNRKVELVMNRHHSMWTIRSPLVFAMVVAVFGVMGILLVDHGPWNKPHLQTAEVNYPTTKAAAKAVGATVTPTEPKPEIEPIAPGPKPAQPPNPVSQ